MKQRLKKSAFVVLALAIVFNTYCFAVTASAAKKYNPAEWNVETSNGSVVSADQSVTKSGNGSVKIESLTGASILTYFSAKQGESYELEFYAKAYNVQKATATLGNQSISLTPISNTYDWTHFCVEYTHTANDGNAVVKFAANAKANSLWIDCVRVYDVNNDKVNILKNPQFANEIITDDLAKNGGGELERDFYELKCSDVFDTETLERVLGGFKNIPIKQANNISVDGSGDDWADYSAIAMPTLSSQYQIYIDPDPNPRDLKANLKMAYDEGRFYFYIEVEDDIHVYNDSSSYWQADSLQIALSRTSDTYGYEIGFMYNSDEDKSNIYTTAITDTEIKAIKYAAKREGNITKYEVAIPWMIYYGSVIPDDMLFDILINENNGTGRRYCVELAPGISEGKTNAEFPLLKFISSDNSWYGWIEGERKPTYNEDNEYTLYLVNYGSDSDFDVEFPEGNNKTVTVRKDSGVRLPFDMNFHDSGSRTMEVKVNKDSIIDYDIIVMPGKDKVEEYTTLFKNELDGISKLMKKCDKAGITYDDELIYYTTAERFIQYMQQDAEKEDFARIDYTIEKLSDMLELAKSNLNAYLDGTKTAIPAPHYIVTGNDIIAGEDILARAEVNGVIEEQRPTYFIGFGHFSTAIKDIPLFNAFGYNVIQSEIGPSTILRARSSIPDWCLEKNGGAKVTVGISSNDKASGNNSIAVTNTTPTASNVFGGLTQDLYLKPSTVYTYGLKIKAKQAVGMWFSMNNFNNRTFLPEDTSEWVEVTGTYTSGPEKTWTTFRIGIDGITEDCYIDDIFVREGTDGENLIINGDAEKPEDGKYWVAYKGYTNTLLDALKSAKENNVAYTLLISPHYLTDNMKKNYPELSIGSGYHQNPDYNVNSAVARQYIEDYLRQLMPLVKDSEAIQSICLANEPHLATVGMEDFYRADYEAFLKEKYHNDINELNRAWTADYTSFSEVPMATTQSYDMKFYDYIQFNDEAFAKWYRFMKDIIREYTDKPVHVKIMHTLAEQDHQGIDRRYKTFFAMNPEKYAEFSEMAGNDAVSFINWISSGEMGALEKEMYYDYLTSLKEMPVNNSEDHIIFDGDSAYDDSYALHTENDLWQGAVHGRTVSTIWSWERATSGTSSFNGLFLYRPDCVAAVGKTNLDLNRNAYEIQALHNEKRDMAILYSISSRVYQTEYMNAVYKAYKAAVFSGKHPLLVNEETIDKIADCDTLIIPHATHCKASAVKAVNDFVNRGGKVLVLGEDSLRFTEETNTLNDEETVKHILASSAVIPCTPNGNFLTDPDDDTLKASVEGLLKESKTEYIRVIDADTGNTVQNVEWIGGIYNGKLIVNICNFELENPKTVKLEVDGKTVEASKELRTQTEYEETVELPGYKPMLLEIDVENPFFDTYGHWCEKNTVSLYKRGIVNGVSSSRYMPDTKITRAEFIALALRSIGAKELTYKNEFKDVKEQDWYAKTLAAAKKYGLTDILEEDGNIKPSQYITREEMSAVLVLLYENGHGSADGTVARNLQDMSEINGKFLPYAKKAVSMGWIEGNENNRFIPLGLTTRGEATAVIDRLLNTLDNSRR